MFDGSNADDMRTLMQSVEADTARTSPNKAKLRGAVLAAFDNAVVPTDENVALERGEAEVISLLAAGEQSTRSSLLRRAVGWAAAAAATFVAVALLVPDGGEPVDIAATNPSESLVVDGTELPAVLLAGPQHTNTIAGGLSFDAPEGLVVLADGDGQLILGLAADPEGSAGQLIFVEVEPSDWAGNLHALADDGVVSVKEIGMLLNGGATTRLDVTITNETLAALSCGIGTPCMSLDGEPAVGPAALWAGSDNRIVEIGRTAHSMVLAIEVSQRFQGPLSTLAAKLVSSAVLTSD